jgi:hydroxymethylbilane synthase
MAPQDDGAVVNIGTRRSALALKQAEIVIAGLRQAHPGVKFEIQARDTAGDRDKSTPLPNLGKGLWTSEFEDKLVAGELDLVVHSAKDMPTNLPKGCMLGAVTKREDPRDAVIFKRYEAETDSRYKTLAELPGGSIVGTSSVRRTAQLRRKYPGLIFRDLRGNIDSRLKKLDAPDSPYDCIILAAAGLNRLDFTPRISQYLDSSAEGGGILHAVGQGALGIEIREGADRVAGFVASVADMPTMLAVLAERSVMRTLEGGCSVPIGVETSWEDEGKQLRLKATVVSVDGKQAVDVDRLEAVSTMADAEMMGKAVAQKLVDLGAQEILDDINASRKDT